jgi:hypothetical protein
MSTELKDRGRRVFLTATAACSAGLLLRTEGTRAAAPVMPEELCEWWSLSDNLLLYQSMVNAVMSDVLARKTVRDARLIDAYIGAQKQLNQVVGLLSKELEKDKAVVDEVTRMNELSEACVATAQLLKPQPGVLPSAEGPAPTAVAAMRDQICLKAQRLLPNDRAEFSGVALVYLKQIICLLTCDEFVEVNRKVTSGNTYTEEALNTIERFNDIRTALEGARSSVLTIEDVCKKEQRAQARKDADLFLKVVIEKLQGIIVNNRGISPDPDANAKFKPLSLLADNFVDNLPDKLPVEQTEIFPTVAKDDKTAASPVDLLLLNVIGARKSVSTLEPLPLPDGISATCENKSTQDKQDRVVMRKAAWIEPTPPQSLFASAMGLLGQYCRPGTPDKAYTCKKIVQGVRLFSWFLSERNSQRLVRQGLNLADKSFSCPGEGDFEALVVGLARLVF